MSAEQDRLEESREKKVPWKKWGPYLSERQWGTVREDYCENGDAWNFFTHDHSRSRAYRWGEDGLAGISDDRQRLCFALALWPLRLPESGSEQSAGGMRGLGLSPDGKLIALMALGKLWIFEPGAQPRAVTCLST